MTSTAVSAAAPRKAAEAINKGQEQLSEDERGEELGWRVKLLRALIRGDLTLTKRILLDHVEVLSMPFTTDLPVPLLQWESLHWWMLQSASPLFIASVYSQPRVVNYLLQRGADRGTACYLKQIPLQVVGECCEHSPALSHEPSADKRQLAVASNECRRLLEAPASLPTAPLVDSVSFECDYSTEIIRVSALSSSAVPSSRLTIATSSFRGGENEAKSSSRVSINQTDNVSRYVQQKVYSCQVTISWDTPDSNGTIIERYELRYRLATSSGNTNEASQGEAEGDKGDESGWRVERSTHNRKKWVQHMVLSGNLQFNTPYECALRSHNAVGKGEWSRSFVIQTNAPPE